MTVRTALGAGRWRLAQQLLTESLLLSILGGAAGLLLGAWVSRLLSSIRLPNDLPMRLDFGFDWPVFAYVAATVLLTGLVAGLVPAGRASATRPADALRDAGRSPGGSSRHRLRDLLVVSQVAGSLVILVVAGLFLRSLGSAHRLELGFEPRGVMNFFMDPAGVGYDETRTVGFYRDLVARVRAMPGVQSASVAHSVPLGYYDISGEIEKEGQTLARDERALNAHFNFVDGAYRQTMGIALLRGRWLTQADEDGRRNVAVINDTLARRLWPEEPALGKRFRLRGGQHPYLEVVGVAGDGKYNSIFERPRPFFYAPHSLEFKSLRVLHVRTAGTPERIAPLVRKEVAALGPDVAPFDVASMQAAVGGGNGFFLVRLAAQFAGALALLALSLAVVGLYGVVAYSAGRRTHEVGIRVALGAGRRSILSMVAGRAVGLVVAGVVLGTLAALALTRLLTSLLFDVSPYDPLTYGMVIAALALVTVVACYLPARRATRVDPAVALRGE